MPGRRSPAAPTAVPGWRALVHDPASGETWLTPPAASPETLQDAVTALGAAFGPALAVWAVYPPDQPAEEPTPPPPGELGCQG